MRGYVERYALYLGAAIALLLTGCDSRTGAYAGDRAASRAASAQAAREAAQKPPGIAL